VRGREVWWCLVLVVGKRNRLEIGILRPAKHRKKRLVQPEQGTTRFSAEPRLMPELKFSVQKCEDLIPTNQYTTAFAGQGASR
jgi:hypothetical protein